MKSSLRSIILACALGSATVTPGIAVAVVAADAYPGRPIKLIVPWTVTCFLDGQWMHLPGHGFVVIDPATELGALVAFQPFDEIDEATLPASDSRSIHAQQRAGQLADGA